MSEAITIARAFVDARRSGTFLSTYPGQPPENLDQAYRIQDHALSIWERPVGGWKVGRIAGANASRLGADRLVGPIFADSIEVATTGVVPMPVFSGGFAAAEAEFMLRISVPERGDPVPETRQDAFNWVSEVRIGIEIASSPYASINCEGPCVTISDHGNNAGLVLGSAIDRKQWEQLDSIAVEVEIDGDTVGQATTATMLDGPFGALRFLLQNLRQRNIAPQSGWWVSSGAITGVHEVWPGQSVSASFATLGQVRAAIGSYDVVCMASRADPSSVDHR